ncbi:MAG: hypothetical protein IJV20_11715, partial [Prevotella sp.]|nr:hypothetical protein [Prevotella sp.]
CGMKRALRIRGRRIWAAVVAVAAAIALVAGGIAAWRHDRAMRAALRDLQAANQADSVFTSDSAAKVLVRYFDHPWHRPNARMLAHYLLGRAHADMGEAPQAIEDYQTAVERADTTDDDCDFRVLRNVWGQMAEVYDAQNLPEDEIEAVHYFIHYSRLIGDTLWAIDGYRSLEKPYELLNQKDSILSVDYKARKQFLLMGDTLHAAATLIAPSFIHIENGEYQRAKEEIDIVHRDAGIFDGEDNLKPGHEMYYYTIGFYFDATSQLDSAEHYYRRVLTAGELEAGYKGLLSVYSKRGIPDSIAKFAPLYADANDEMHREMNSAEVHKTASLYNYNRHLRIAKEEQRKAQGRLIALYITIIIILAFIIVGYSFYSRNIEKERRREHALNTIRESYHEVNAAYHRLRQEAEDNKSHIELVKHELEELQSQKEQLDILSSSLKEKNKVGYYYSHDIVQGVIDTAVGDKQPIAGRVLIQLQGLFAAAFPHFVTFVKNTHTLTDIEWYVCILMDLGLNNGDIASLTGYTTSRISNIKVQISRILFHEDSSMGLLKNLRIKIHPNSSRV